MQLECNIILTIEDKMSNMRTFRCDNNLWRRFKLICTVNNISMQSKLQNLVNNFVEQEYPKVSSEIKSDDKSNKDLR